MPRSPLRIGHILCAVDFSEPSRRALRHAAALASQVEGTLTVLYVNDPLLSTAAAASGYDSRLLDARTERELKRFVHRTVGASRASAPRRVVALGRPEREILRVASGIEAGLIVVGTHGLTGPDKLLLGSTTERILRTTRLPVLAVPARGPRRPARDWPRGPVLAGIDLDGSAPADVRAAAEFARLLQSDLLLVHVLPPLRGPSWLRLGRAAPAAQRVARARAAVARLAGDLDADVEVSFRVLNGVVAPTLARLARANRAGTLALILRARSGVLAPVRGAITYQVLTTATTPVLAIPG